MKKLIVDAEEENQRDLEKKWIGEVWFEEEKKQMKMLRSVRLYKNRKST